MSHSTLYAVGRASALPLFRYPNSWGTAAQLWRLLARRYLQTESWSHEQTMKDVWRLHADPAVHPDLRIALRFTFDDAVTPKKSLPRLVQALQLVGNELAVIYPDCVNHWPELAQNAEFIYNTKAMLSRRRLGIALGCTSVSDPWERWKGRDVARVERFFDATAIS